MEALPQRQPRARLPQLDRLPELELAAGAATRLDDVWFYGGSEQAVHYRNALANPNAVMHLPDPMRAVIVEGVVRLAHPSPETAERLAQASKAKYGYAPDPSAYDGALGLFPRRVRAWTFPSDATRFRFA